jgi:hypothetical protein
MKIIKVLSSLAVLAMITGCTQLSPKSLESSDSSSQGSSEQVTYEAHERYYFEAPIDAREWMRFSLDALNYWDPGGPWIEDTYDASSPLVVGVLLDTYSVYPAGCAAWFFHSEDDALSAMVDGSVNLFSDDWVYWSNDSGHVILVVANSFSDLCFGNIVSELDLNSLN